MLPDVLSRSYVEKTAGLDASHPATVAAKAKGNTCTASLPRTPASGRMATAIHPSQAMGTATSGAGRQSVESLVAALAAEQSQRLKKVGVLPV